MGLEISGFLGFEPLSKKFSPAMLEENNARQGFFEKA
jgi:hypothetical protein